MELLEVSNACASHEQKFVRALLNLYQRWIIMTFIHF